MPIINYDREMKLFEMALEGDDNGDFSQMEVGTAKKTAIGTLVTHLDMLLLGGTMSTEYRAAMEHFLFEADGLKANDNTVEAWNLIQIAIRFIATSSRYMIQK